MVATRKQAKSQPARPEDEKTENERHQQERISRIDEIIQTREAAFLDEEKVLLSWEAPARVFKPRSREYYTTIGAIVVLFCIILLFAGQFLLMFVVIAFAFVSYMLATVKPDNTTHEISSRGIRTGGNFYRWDELGRYWFQENLGQDVLYIETIKVFPNPLMMVINKKDEPKIKELLAPYVLLEKPEPGFVDNAAKWLSEKIPLEGA